MEQGLPVQRGNVSLLQLRRWNGLPSMLEHGCKWRGLPRAVLPQWMDQACEDEEPAISA